MQCPSPRESHAAGRQRILFGPVPLADFQNHRHPQPASRFTNRHDIGHQPCFGWRNTLLQNLSSRLRKQTRSWEWRSKGWNPSKTPQRRLTHTRLLDRDLLYDSCTESSPSEQRTNCTALYFKVQPHVSGPSQAVTPAALPVDGPFVCRSWGLGFL